MSDSHYTSRSPREPYRDEAYVKVSIARAETIAILDNYESFFTKNLSIVRQLGMMQQMKPQEST